MSAIHWVYKIKPEKSLFKGNAYHIVKRIMDLVLVIGSAVFTLPMIAFIALMVKIISPGGPVFFSQCRTGKGGVRFNMYKIRTMIPNAEELKKKNSLI
jgi:lipopolysaccharide/colanic/teichoic acid biosynthesis glycosyltransferase